MDAFYIVELARNDADFLRRLAESDAVVSKLPITLEGALVKTTANLSQDLGDRLTELQAIVGFDENYALNEEGQILERLIHAFIVP